MISPFDKESIAIDLVPCLNFIPYLFTETPFNLVEIGIIKYLGKPLSFGALFLIKNYAGFYNLKRLIVV